MVTTFKDYLVKSNLTANTIRSYEWTVKYFTEHYSVVNKKNLLAYKGYLVENFKPQTVNLRLQAINKYLEFTKQDKLKMKFVKVQQKNFLENVISDADYTINATMVIRHLRDGFVFSNPGTMLVSKEQYYTGGDSVCRNKSLQKMFSMIGVAEKAGSGTDKIMKGWREANWRSPKIDEQMQPDKVQLVMPMESLLSDRAKAMLTDKFGIAAQSFSHNVLSVLALACDEGDITNQRLRYVLNMHKAEIADLLKLMVQKGLLEAYGYGRGMHYKLPAKSICLFESNSASSDANSASSDANSASSGKKRLSKDELKTLIISICADWVSIEDIVAKSGKSLSYVRNSVIPLLLAEKTIVMMYPGTPNNPNQKYKVKE